MPASVIPSKTPRPFLPTNTLPPLQPTASNSSGTAIVVAPLPTQNSILPSWSNMTLDELAHISLDKLSKDDLLVQAESFRPDTTSAYGYSVDTPKSLGISNTAAEVSSVPLADNYLFDYLTMAKIFRYGSRELRTFHDYHYI